MERVLYVAGKLSYSNPAIYTVELCRGLVEAERRTFELATHGGALATELRREGVELYTIRHNLLSWRRMMRFFVEFDPDVVHATGGALALRSATRIARKLRKPLIHTVHSWLPEDRAERYPRELAGLVVVHQALREHVVNERDFPKGQVRVIPYGVDVSTPPPVRGSIEGRTPVVGTIGRLGEGRRHDLFLEAARRLLDDGQSVHFIVAGEGPNEDALRRQVKLLKLEESVTFVDPVAGVDLFAVCDIVAFVSDWGGIGLNLLEAMKNRCPIVATGGGEVYSILDQRGMCEIVPSGDVGQLAHAIVDLLSDEEKRSELAENAYQYVVTHHPLDAHLNALAEYYASLGS